MKQLIFRLIPGAPAVLDCLYGTITDGQFVADSEITLPNEIMNLIVVDDLLGTTAYIQAKNLSKIIRLSLDQGANIIVYPNFFVLNFSDYESKEEEDA